MEYMHMLNISHLPELISELTDLALLLLSATHKTDELAFDFYLNHTLTLFIVCNSFFLCIQIRRALFYLCVTYGY